jgi:hypothetical protein
MAHNDSAAGKRRQPLTTLDTITRSRLPAVPAPSGSLWSGCRADGPRPCMAPVSGTHRRRRRSHGARNTQPRPGRPRAARPGARPAAGLPRRRATRRGSPCSGRPGRPCPARAVVLPEPFPRLPGRRSSAAHVRQLTAPLLLPCLLEWHMGRGYVVRIGEEAAGSEGVRDAAVQCAKLVRREPMQGSR